MKTHRTLPVVAGVLVVGLVLCFCCTSVSLAGHTNNILLIGYWPPTNEMLRQFSQDPVQNPGGWQGGNWEGRGYDVYAYFPEFPGGTGSNPKGDGDFEVDYQDTSADFWDRYIAGGLAITDTLHPISIISYGKGGSGQTWELEFVATNWGTWGNDYLDPKQPNQSPPDPDNPAGYDRYSTLPVNEIETAIDNAGIGVNAYVSNYIGNFLCGYMAYHTVWYQNLHNDQSDPHWCISAGFTHMGGGLDVETQAIPASEIALRETIAYVDSIVPEPATMCMLVVGGLALLMRRCRRI